MKFSKAEVDAIIEASPRTFVPFNKLALSEDHQARSAVSVWRPHIDRAAERGEDAGPALAWERSEGVDSEAQAGCQRCGSSSSI